MENTPFEVGKTYIIRTVTMTDVGRVSKITKKFLVLEDAAWVGDSGRWADALKTGNLNEIEPFPESCFVSLAAIADATEWRHPLPRQQK